MKTGDDVVCGAGAIALPNSFSNGTQAPTTNEGDRTNPPLSPAKLLDNWGLMGNN
ncbi:hypothetical protein [Microseira wollei]|uniref:hypothetical protein n=1 Tax=Microseira wollei TaxID=467598 RepID=UPI001CFC64AA|nr:hypothetical protein [Microseira wollei]